MYTFSSRGEGVVAAIVGELVRLGSHRERQRERERERERELGAFRKRNALLLCTGHV